MALMVFCVGLHARIADLAYLVERPSLLLRSLLAMNVIMPAIAVGIALAFDLNHPLEVALIALAVSPVPPILPGNQLKAGGRSSYVVGLLVTTALVSIVFVPTAAVLIGRVFGYEVHTAASAIAWIVVTSILAPLLAGVVVRRLAAGIAARIAGPLSHVATIVLVVAFLPVLLKIWPAIVALVRQLLAAYDRRVRHGRARGWTRSRRPRFCGSQSARARDRVAASRRRARRRAQQRRLAASRARHRAGLPGRRRGARRRLHEVDRTFELRGRTLAAARLRARPWPHLSARRIDTARADRCTRSRSLLCSLPVARTVPRRRSAASCRRRRRPRSRPPIRCRRGTPVRRRPRSKTSSPA